MTDKQSLCENNRIWSRRDMLGYIGTAGAIGLAGCSETMDTGDNGGGGGDSGGGSTMLQTAAGSPGGTGYVIMNAMLSSASSANQNIGYNILPGGWVGNNNRLQDQEIDMGHTTIVAGTLAATGQDPYDQEGWDQPPSNIRSILNDQSELFYYVVAQPDFEYETLTAAAEDEYPISITNQAEGTFGGFVWDTVLEQHDYGQERIEELGGTFRRVSWDDAAEMYLDQNIDAILAVSGRSVGWLENIAASRDPNYLNWTDENREFFSENYGLMPTELEADGLPGLSQELRTMQDSGHIATHVDVDDETINMFVSGVIEQEEQIRNSTDILQLFEANESMHEDTPYELHPGAEQAYQDAGLL